MSEQYYFQTWNKVAKLRYVPWIGARLILFVQWICKRIIGHERSTTEWGYGGGEFVDIWCRWCNQPGSMPMNEAKTAYPNLRSIVWRGTQCDINQEIWTPEPEEGWPSGKAPGLNPGDADDSDGGSIPPPSARNAQP